MGSKSLASTLKALHQPSRPLILANVWDIASLNAVLGLNTQTSRPVQAIATASWAFAASLGIKDEDLTFEQNIAAIRALSPIVSRANLPLTVDLQDGYGSRLQEAITAAIKAGAHGANLEDSIPSRGLGQGIEGSLYPLEAQVQRLRSALSAARDAGCPDFVINARCDVFALGESAGLTAEVRIAEAVRRGRAYLENGATTIFVWRGSGTGMEEEEVKVLVKEFQGMIAIRQGQAKGALSTTELGKLGVARISVGPSLFQLAMRNVQKNALQILGGGNLDAH